MQLVRRISIHVSMSKILIIQNMIYIVVRNRITDPVGGNSNSNKNKKTKYSNLTQVSLE